MKGERDKTRLARDKPEGGMPMFEGQRASEVLWSSVSVGVGDGDPCSNKDARVVNVLETTEVPENGHVGIRASPPQKVAGSIAQLKCIYTNGHSMDKKQENWEPLCSRKTIIQLPSWKHGGNETHNWSAAMDGYKIF